MSSASKMDDGHTTLSQLKARVQAFCEAREWDPLHGAKDLAIGISAESAELWLQGIYTTKHR